MTRPSGIPTTELVTAVVPVRHDSERVAGKNRRLFDGEPLFMRILRTLGRAQRVGAIAVDTDSPEIAAALRRTIPSVRIVDRPMHLRGGEVPVNRLLAHDLAVLQGGAFLQTHCTNPLLGAETIDRAIEAFFSAQTAGTHDSVLSVTRWHTRLYDAEGRALNHDPAVLRRTQDLPPIFEENSNLYVFSREGFRRTGRRVGDRPALFEIDRLEAMDIDDEASWRIAELAVRSQAQTQINRRDEAAA